MGVRPQQAGRRLFRTARSGRPASASVTPAAAACTLASSRTSITTAVKSPLSEPVSRAASSSLIAPPNTV
jgi:hypothetical protein